MTNIVPIQYLIILNLEWGCWTTNHHLSLLCRSSSTTRFVQTLSAGDFSPVAPTELEKVMSEERTPIVRAELLRRMDKMQTRFPSRESQAPAAETAHQAESALAVPGNDTNPFAVAG